VRFSSLEVGCDTEDYRSVGVPLPVTAPYAEPVTVLHPPVGSLAGVRPESGSAPFADLAADAAEVRRHLAQVPPARPRLVSIPAQAVAIVSDLDAYGD
jgi:hypothetical protein